MNPSSKSEGTKLTSQSSLVNLVVILVNKGAPVRESPYPVQRLTVADGNLNMKEPRNSCVAAQACTATQRSCNHLFPPPEATQMLKTACEMFTNNSEALAVTNSRTSIRSLRGSASRYLHTCVAWNIKIVFKRRVFSVARLC
jgi:hypothetical protein